MNPRIVHLLERNKGIFPATVDEKVAASSDCEIAGQMAMPREKEIFGSPYTSKALKESWCYSFSCHGLMDNLSHRKASAVRLP